MRVALTGASGFIGQHLRLACMAEGHTIRVLMRQDADLPGCLVVKGDLHDPDALARLADGADILVHAAGLVRTYLSTEFDRVNVEGTANVTHAAVKGGARMLLLSSLAAREPDCSHYARSKHMSEQVAIANMSPRSLTIVRPPAVYGPGDPVTMPIFQQMDHGLMLIPAARHARFSMMYVGDLVELLQKLLCMQGNQEIIEPDDGKAKGYSWSDIRAIGEEVVDRKVRLVRLPRWSVSGAASIFDRLALWKKKPMLLSSDKLGELYHANWVAAGHAKTTSTTIGFAQGAAKTLAWYRANNWLKNA